MCMQCVAGAMAAGAGATGMRAWLAAKRPAFMTPKRMRAVTVVLMSAAVLASATLLSGSG